MSAHCPGCANYVVTSREPLTGYGPCPGLPPLSRLDLWRLHRQCWAPCGDTECPTDHARCHRVTAPGLPTDVAARLAEALRGLMNADVVNEDGDLTPEYNEAYRIASRALDMFVARRDE